ncbi:hypothetical protein NP493_979g01031 [Ridgeia piscesae]|uniref:Uncharacterized protein n=1 Tax=Ridgeia piscesae TaxID=27915 RepID=A0AAD9NJ56_RIDPI|nr:hypothetical protein NP493_979g01031 [Ridgeia piscesae]
MSTLCLQEFDHGPVLAVLDMLVTVAYHEYEQSLSAAVTHTDQARHLIQLLCSLQTNVQLLAEKSIEACDHLLHIPTNEVNELVTRLDRCFLGTTLRQLSQMSTPPHLSLESQMSTPPHLSLKSQMSTPPHLSLESQMSTPPHLSLESQMSTPPHLSLESQMSTPPHLSLESQMSTPPHLSLESQMSTLPHLSLESQMSTPATLVT